ncbi:putative bifunctional diguanylate cyclase/phosphodiesterase [Pseudarthrobacter sp. S9]|uniref:putative bifunctional diguanylate cyclase/phosphodiesterase n=1 Tax=Pseudarthrobacter sp. S9 TaxID=3418421 RepID=UPI003D03E33F
MRPPDPTVHEAQITSDLGGMITAWNAGATEMFGFTPAEAIGRNYDLLTTKHGSVFHPEILTHLRAGRPATAVRTRWRRNDGRLAEVLLTLSPVFDAEGMLIGGSTIARDITAVEQLQDEAGKERERLIEAQEMAHVGSAEYDVSSGQWWHSEEFGRLLDLTTGEKISGAMLLAKTHAQDRDGVRTDWHTLDRAGSGHLEREVRIIQPSGDIRWIHANVRVTDTGGVPTRVLITALDITARKLAEAVLTHQASHDALTGLPNRILINAILHDLLGRKAPKVVVFFLDVDRFKTVNDAIGHAAGDAILIQLAARLRPAIRPGDTVGRFGGDEFVVICKNLRAREAQAVAERLREAVKEAFLLGGRRIFLNISIGIAPASPGDTAETVLDAADMAMYQAKNAGGDRIAVRDARTQATATDRLNLESDLRLALGRNEFRLHYQPVIDLKTGTPVGFEALLRWEHPKHGLLAPSNFISLAEDNGMIVPIGRWVLNQALLQTQQWRDALPGAEDLTISVNVSVCQLQDLGFIHTVRDALRATAINPDAVTLEITESVLMSQDEQATITLQGLRACGVRLAIDDFGTGYSSLSYLRWLSAHTLKIDRSFVAELGYKDPSSASIIQLVLGMARVLNLDVIAEGVETPAQLDELGRLGVPHAQGYLWCVPLPAHDIPNWIQTHAP